MTNSNDLECNRFRVNVFVKTGLFRNRIGRQRALLLVDWRVLTKKTISRAPVFNFTPNEAHPQLNTNRGHYDHLHTGPCCDLAGHELQVHVDYIGSMLCSLLQFCKSIMGLEN